MKTEYMVYWTKDDGAPGSTLHVDLTSALSIVEFHRKQGKRHVTMCAENSDQVGKMGADAVVNGVCPDGGPFLGRTSRYGMDIQKNK